MMLFLPLTIKKLTFLNTLQILHTVLCSSNVTAATESVKSAQWLTAKLNDRNTLFIHCHKNSSCSCFIT